MVAENFSVSCLESKVILTWPTAFGASEEGVSSLVKWLASGPLKVASERSRTLVRPAFRTSNESGRCVGSAATIPNEADGEATNRGSGVCITSVICSRIAASLSASLKILISSRAPANERSDSRQVVPIKTFVALSSGSLSPELTSSPSTRMVCNPPL